MKLLVFVCLIAVSLAAPVASPDHDDNVAVESSQAVTSVVGAPSVFDTQILSGAPVFQQNAVAYSVPVSFNQGANFIAGAVPYSAGAPAVYELKEIDDDDDVKYVKQGYSALAYAPAGVTAYSAGQTVASPAITSYYSGQAVASPSVATYSVGNVVAAPVQYRAAAVAPAVATVQHEAVVREVKPVSVAVPSAITYEAAHTVQLAPKEINVPVQHQTVQIPVEKRVLYGTENYVAGSTTVVHKPQIIAPAISAPNVFVAKTRQAAPEVTVHQSEITVEQKSPNYVAAPFDAGVVLEKAAPHVNQIDVPTPVEVPHPVNVPTPYAVPVAHPIKVKSSVNPVVNVDVHTVETENVVTPIEYTAHHHVATAPVVAAPAVAVQAAPAVKYAAGVIPAAVTYGAGAAPAAVTYGAAAAPAAVTYGAVAAPTAVTYGAVAAPTAVTYGAVAAPAAVTYGAVAAPGALTVQGVATQGVVTQDFATQGVIAGGQAVGYAAVPTGQNFIFGSSSPVFVDGSLAGVPSASVTGQNIEQGDVKFVSVGSAQTGIASNVITYSAAKPDVAEQNVVVGTSKFVAAPAAKVYFDSA